MKHDDRCESRAGYAVHRCCRCEVRALEAKLAALRPLVRAAVDMSDRWGLVRLSMLTGGREVYEAVNALDPDLIAWAKGGE